MHHEMMKRSSDILILLANKEELTPENLDLIWESSIGKQETTVGVIFKVIKQLSNVLSADHLDYILTKIRELNREYYEKRTVKLIRKLVLNCAYNNDYLEVKQWRNYIAL